MARNLRQHLQKISVGVIGGYHGSNVGDMALGVSVHDILALKNIKSGLQTVYNLERWPHAPYAILGGGAVGYVGLLKRISQRYKHNLGNVALLGVDFNEKEYPDECLELIRKAAFVSARSKAQADRLTSISGRTDIFSHPDIAFSLMSDFCQRQRAINEKNDSKVLLINLVPLYANVSKGRYEPLEAYRTERPELYQNFHTMHKSYIKMINTIVDEALQKGFKIESIPFTPEDSEYSKIVLKGLPVTHLAYQSDPYKVLKKVAGAEWMVATRFHATVFALKAGIKLTPIAYATKNELMLRDAGVEKKDFLSTLDLANGILDPLPPVIGNIDKIKLLELQSTNAIKTCIERLHERGC